MKTPEEWVDIIEPALAAIISGGVTSYSIAGRSFTKHNLSELQRLYDFWYSRAISSKGGITTIADMRTGRFLENDQLG